MKVLQLLALATAIVASADAAAITGQLWIVPDGVAQNAVLANVPATAPNVTFEVNSPLNFTVPGSINDFLLSGGAFNIAGSASDLANPISPSITEFQGQVTVTTGQQFTVTHDDGLTLTIGNVDVISTPGPTGPVQTVQTYSGPSGTFPFTLVYGECCGGQAVLQIDLPFQPSTVPEPASYATLAMGLLIAGVMRRRRVSVRG